MKVRIKTAPREREMDGINLNALQPGTVREVSACIGTWLIVEGYAEPEMRRSAANDDGTPSKRLPEPQPGTAHTDRRRR